MLKYIIDFFIINRFKVAMLECASNVYNYNWYVFAAPCPYKTLLSNQRQFESIASPGDIFECEIGFIFDDSDILCTCIPVTQSKCDISVETLVRVLCPKVGYVHLRTIALPL